jgi:hypothetical protein
MTIIELVVERKGAKRYVHGQLPFISAKLAEVEGRIRPPA